MISANFGSAYFAESLTELERSQQHLQAELARIDVLIQRAVRRWQLAGQDTTDAFRGLYVSDAEATQLLQHPLGSNWGQQISLPEGEERALQQAEQQAVLHIRSIQDAAKEQGVTTRLQDVVEAFDLDEFEKDILLICLAPAFDLRYEKIFGYLQNDITRKRPGTNLALDLLDLAGFERLFAFTHFAMEAPLFKYHLLERFSEAGQNKSPLLSQSLLIDETVVHWLLGSYQPTGEYAPYLRLDPASVDLAGDEISGASDAPYPATLYEQNPIFIFSGPDRLAQQVAAHKLALRTKRPLLTLNLNLLPREEAGLAQAVIHALRDARLTGAIAFIQAWDACLEDGMLPADLLAELIRHPGMVILAGQATWRPGSLPYERPIRWQEFPLPAYPERKILWQRYLNQANVTTTLDLTNLVGQFALTEEQIRDSVLLAMNRTTQKNESLTENDLIVAARESSSSRLSGMAHKIPSRYRWADIVLPADQISLLQEIVATVRGRTVVLEEWGLGRKLVSSRGVSVLFAGPPGTGKTMAAEIIAAELSLDLYKIDLSTIVSKYIGETEKNLERIFAEAESSNAILFFDEADALFGKRSEVRDSHDRYANVEISYLLQRMEAYDGVTILATNLRANLDEAFTRRLQFAVDFPFPDEADRLRIWETLFPLDVPRARDLDFEMLAKRFKLAGGNIRNIIVNAAYLAAADGGQVTMDHLVHGTRRELQKMGRLVGDHDLG